MDHFFWSKVFHFYLDSLSLGRGGDEDFLFTGILGQTLFQVLHGQCNFTNYTIGLRFFLHEAGVLRRQGFQLVMICPEYVFGGPDFRENSVAIWVVLPGLRDGEDGTGPVLTYGLSAGFDGL